MSAADTQLITTVTQGRDLIALDGLTVDTRGNPIDPGAQYYVKRESLSKPVAKCWRCGLEEPK